MSTDTDREPAGLVRRVRRSLKAAAYSGPGRDRWQQPRRLVEALEILPDMRVADLGAGGGYFTFRLSRAVGRRGRVYAVDTDADLRSLVADRAAERDLDQVVPVAGTPDDPCLPEPVDRALLVNAFHHLPDPSRYLAAVADSLTPRGRLAIVEPPPRWSHFGHDTDPADIRDALARTGYEVIAEHDFLPRQHVVVAALAAPGAEAG